MKAVAVGIAAILMAAPAAAQRPRVPVPLIANETWGPCSTAEVRNLQGTDGFLAVRAGPSRRERELTRLHDGKDVYACVRRGDWFGIVFERTAGGRACAWVLDRQRRSSTYRGPCGSGWVHERYLFGYADFVSP